MATAPPGWRALLHHETLTSTADLVREARASRDALREVAVSFNRGRREQTSFAPRDGEQRRPYQHFNNQKRYAHDVEHTGYDSAPEDEPAASGSGLPDGVAEIYAAIEKRQRPPPPGGYPFKRRDDVKTRLSRKPPSPCKYCSSPEHWDRECPHAEVFKAKRDAHLLENFQDRPYEEESAYRNVYSALLNDYAISNYVSREAVQEAYMSLNIDVPEPPSDVHPLPDWYPALLVEVDCVEFGPPTEAEALTTSTRPLRDPSTNSDEVVIMPRCRETRPGRAAEGVPVLTTDGWLCAPDGPMVDLRLDSCANLSLMSEALYDSLGAGAPPIQRGMRLQLVQLTSSDVKILGFVTLPVFARTTKGEVLEFSLEAYVVRNMTAPLLLGEDFQRLYNVCVERRQGQATLSFADLPYTVTAQPVREPMEDAVAKRAYFGHGARLVRVAEAIHIPAGSVAKVRVRAPFRDDRVWMLDKGMLNAGLEPTFAIPNTLVEQDSPFVPVANLSLRPRVLRAGEILGQLQDPAQYLDSPQSEKALAKMLEKAAATRALIE
ncbi:hypothetical protein PENSPDRAFT_594694, partial [Peniophora sp. CONT]